MLGFVCSLKKCFQNEACVDRQTVSNHLQCISATTTAALAKSLVRSPGFKPASRLSDKDLEAAVSMRL